MKLEYLLLAGVLVYTFWRSRIASGETTPPQDTSNSDMSDNPEVDPPTSYGYTTYPSNTDETGLSVVGLSTQRTVFTTGSEQIANITKAGGVVVNSAYLGNPLDVQYTSGGFGTTFISSRAPTTQGEADAARSAGIEWLKSWGQTVNDI